MESISLLKVLLLDFVVEEPFVDLDPSETSLLNGLVFHLFAELSLVLVKNFNENLDLVVSFAPSVVLIEIFLHKHLTATLARDFKCTLGIV